MASACIHIGIYVWIFRGVGAIELCAVRAFPHADMADADALCGIWNTNREDEWKGAEVVPDSIGAGGGSMLGVELV